MLRGLYRSTKNTEMFWKKRKENQEGLYKILGNVLIISSQFLLFFFLETDNVKILGGKTLYYCEKTFLNTFLK